MHSRYSVASANYASSLKKNRIRAAWLTVFLAVSALWIRVFIWVAPRSFDVAERQSTWLIETTRWNETFAARAFIYYGENIHAKDEEGKTAVYHAAWGRHYRLANLLLERGASKKDYIAGLADRRKFDKEYGYYD